MVDIQIELALRLVEFKQKLISGTSLNRTGFTFMFRFH